MTDRSWLGEDTLYHQVEEAILGGATFIQLREKELSQEAFLEEAKEIKELCRKYFKTGRQWYLWIFTSSEVSVGKSNPLIYQEAAKFLGTELEETYVFEDVLYAIETAKKAGFHTVGIYDQYSARDTEKIKQEAEFYLESMEHASEILENL